MLKNYLKIAIRSLTKQKGISFINIFGLSVGISCFILLLLYSINEFSFDRFHKNEKNIYRVYERDLASDGNNAGSVSMPNPLGPSLKKDLPDIINYVRIKQPSVESFMRIHNEVYRVRVSYADPELFTVFTFPLKHGNPTSVLKNINNIVLTESKAKELFGNEDVIGKTVELKVDNVFQPFIVSGVVQDIPPNSSIRFEVLGSFEFFETTEFGKISNNWYVTAFRTFVQLRPGSNLSNENKRLSFFYNTYHPNEKSKTQKGDPVITYGLQPLRSIHTDIKLSDSSGVETINPRTIWIILSIATGILFIACINFTTLSIGRSAARSIEVGIRKVIGAERKQLIAQFLIEALLLSILSTLLGLLLTELLLPYFNNLTGRNLHLSMALYPEMFWFMIELVLFVALLSGSYPALLLSNFKPIEVLKSKLRLGGSNLFTKILVTIQFAVSIVLIVSTVIILQQTIFMTDKNPGFNKENVIIVDASQTNAKSIYPLFKQALITHKDVKGIAEAEVGLGEGTDFGLHGFKFNGIHKHIYEYLIDPDYINVLGMQLITGRNFSPAISDDTVNSVIINEAAANDFGWTSKNAIGQHIKGYTDKKSPVVIGIVKNFNFQPLTEKIQPQLFHQFPEHSPQKFFIRIQASNPAPLLAYIKTTWDNLVPDAPFKYSFLDENINNFYKSEQIWSRIIGWAGTIAIFLACLGLFGLAALAAVKRTKEIGIRKVLGASAFTILNLISKDFLRLIMIAFIIATPVAWYFMSNWLQDFAYRISIKWWVFAVAGLSVLFIALLTIGVKTIKAAMANPVSSLRVE